MRAEKIQLHTLDEAIEAIEALGASNCEMMATRAVYINVLVRRVPGELARVLKSTYNDVGAEAAVSHDAYHQKTGAVTDMIVMGSLYQHREVRRILAGDPAVGPLLAVVETVVETAAQTSKPQ